MSYPRDIFDPSRQIRLLAELPLSPPLPDRMDDAERTIEALSARIADLELRREVSESVFSLLLALFVAGRTDRDQIITAIRNSLVTANGGDKRAVETARLKSEQFVQDLVDRIEWVLRGTP